MKKLSAEVLPPAFGDSSSSSFSRRYRTKPSPCGAMAPMIPRAFASVFTSTESTAPASSAAASRPSSYSLTSGAVTTGTAAARLDGCHASAHSANEASAAALSSGPLRSSNSPRMATSLPKKVSPTFAAVPMTPRVVAERSVYPAVWTRSFGVRCEAVICASARAAISLGSPTPPPPMSASMSASMSIGTSASSSQPTASAERLFTPTPPSVLLFANEPSRVPSVSVSIASSALCRCFGFPASAAVMSGSTHPTWHAAARPALPLEASRSIPAHASRCETVRSDSRSANNERAVDSAPDAAAGSSGETPGNGPTLSNAACSSRSVRYDPETRAIATAHDLAAFIRRFDASVESASS